MLEALGMRLLGFYNIIFGDPLIAERELFSNWLESDPRNDEKTRDPLRTGREMLKTFIEKYEIIAERAGWKSQWPYACAVSVNAWFDENDHNQHYDRIFHLSVTTLFELTERPNFPDGFEVVVAKALLNADYPE